MRLNFDVENGTLKEADDGVPVSLVIMDGKAVMVFDQGGRQKGSKAQKDYAKRWLDVFLAEPRKVMAVNADLLAACEAALDRLDSTLNEMTTRTKIEWTEATWNPVTGCTPISPGCAHCYARRMAKRLAGRCGYPAAPHEFDVTLRVDRLDEPLRWKKPRRVFVCSMSDLFHENVPFGFIRRVFRTMEFARAHTFQVLTKRADRMHEFVQWYASDRNAYWPSSNVWLGVTAENQEQADKRIPLLLQTPAAVRFVSVEPMLGLMDLSEWLGVTFDKYYGKWIVDERDCISGKWWLDWVICGGETGPGARPMHPDWVRSLRDQCQEAAVPFFFKSWGDWAPDCLCGGKDACREIDRPEPGKPGVMFRCGKKASGRSLDGREWSEYPEQEQP